jgi:hypothetical protein
MKRVHVQNDAIGTFRTSCNVRLESAMRSKTTSKIAANTAPQGKTNNRAFGARLWHFI